MMSKAECSLRDLHVGDKGRIERVSVSGELGRRIRDRGLIPAPASLSWDALPCAIPWPCASKA